LAIAPTFPMTLSHVFSQSISSTISKLTSASFLAFKLILTEIFRFEETPLIVFTITSVLFPAFSISDSVCSSTWNNTARSSEFSGTVTPPIFTAQEIVTVTEGMNALGRLDGVSLGMLLGIADGNVLGVTLGTSDGDRLGIIDGCIFGTLLGIADGAILGIAFGTLDGKVVGSFDGFLDGCCDGCIDGSCVGF